MKTLAFTIIALTILVAPAGARTQTHQVSARLIASSAVHTATTARVPLSATSAKLQSAITFNGQIPASCWADSQLQFECGWHGAFVIVSGTKGPGPLTLRALSMRHDRVTVFARFSW